MQDLRLTLLQAELHWLNPSANRAMFEASIASVSSDSDLIVLPEMFTTGFTMDAADHSEEMQGTSVAWLRKLAQVYSTAISGSLIIEENGNYFNRLIWATADGDLHHYDKRHLFRMADEHNHYTAGTDRLLVTLGDWRICPLICYDLRFPVWSRSRNDYDLLIYVANWPSTRVSAWETLLPARAVENLCYSAGINRTGRDGNQVPYPGGSVISDYLGTAVATGGHEPKTVQATLSLDKLNRYREKFPAWKDADNFALTPGHPAE